ncbi:DUF3289 family protein [Winslowiella sp. 2C04]|uniref:DUF3289 family protein n=1 Tax=Winslowiella sp. 2C04 TaxID=3416179 RepID=UPI003CEA0539
MDTPVENPRQALPIRLPIRLFETQKRMNDYKAEDMKFGDLTQFFLQEYYQPNNISKNINPFTHPNRDESARILFDEFRQLSDTFSFIGPYKGLIRSLIDHMQHNTGKKFTDKLMDDALAGHSSMDDSLNKINKAMIKLIDWDARIYSQQDFYGLEDAIRKSVLPKFNEKLDRINGLTISIHDTWSTHITLNSLEITGDRYKAKVHYRIQDHFGLDDNDINDWLYKQFRIFRIWFTLQRWEGYGFKPFITEMNATMAVEGGRFDKI